MAIEEIKRGERYLIGAKVSVNKGTFAIVKARRPHSAAFANIIDDNEITVIIDQARVDELDVIEISKGWRLLTFHLVIPFGVVGFLSRVSQALADEHISIFAISSYSTDHILVKEDDEKKAEMALTRLGCVVIR